MQGNVNLIYIKINLNYILSTLSDLYIKSKSAYIKLKLCILLENMLLDQTSNFFVITKGEIMSEIESRVIRLVAEHLDVDASKVKPDARFSDDLGADSLDQVELVMAFEDEFNVEIPDNVAEKIVKVEDAVNFIKSQIEKAS